MITTERNVQYVFSVLSRGNATAKHDTVPASVNILDTLHYQHGSLRSWYYLDDATGEVLKRDRRECSKERILEVFGEGVTTGCPVAIYLHHCAPGWQAGAGDDSGKGSTIRMLLGAESRRSSTFLAQHRQQEESNREREDPDPLTTNPSVLSAKKFCAEFADDAYPIAVDYFDHNKLEGFLETRENKHDVLVQRFVDRGKVNDNFSTIEAVWSPYQLYLNQRQSIVSVRQADVPLQTRCHTFDNDALFNRPLRTTAQMRAKVQKECENIVRQIKLVDQKHVIRMVAYFSVTKHNTPVLLWVPELQMMDAPAQDASADSPQKSPTAGKAAALKNGGAVGNDVSSNTVPLDLTAKEKDEDLLSAADRRATANKMSLQRQRRLQLISPPIVPSDVHLPKDWESQLVNKKGKGMFGGNSPSSPSPSSGSPGARNAGRSASSSTSPTRKGPASRVTALKGVPRIGRRNIGFEGIAAMMSSGGPTASLAHEEAIPTEIASAIAHKRSVDQQLAMLDATFTLSKAATTASNQLDRQRRVASVAYAGGLGSRPQSRTGGELIYLNSPNDKRQGHDHLSSRNTSPLPSSSGAAGVSSNALQTSTATATNATLATVLADPYGQSETRAVWTAFESLPEATSPAQMRALSSNGHGRPPTPIAVPSSYHTDIMGLPVKGATVRGLQGKEAAAAGTSSRPSTALNSPARELDFSLPCGFSSKGTSMLIDPFAAEAERRQQMNRARDRSANSRRFYTAAGTSPNQFTTAGAGLSNSGGVGGVVTSYRSEYGALKQTRVSSAGGVRGGGGVGGGAARPPSGRLTAPLPLGLSHSQHRQTSLVISHNPNNSELRNESSNTPPPPPQSRRNRSRSPSASTSLPLNEDPTEAGSGALTFHFSANKKEAPPARGDVVSTLSLSRQSAATMHTSNSGSGSMLTPCKHIASSKDPFWHCKEKVFSRGGGGGYFVRKVRSARSNTTNNTVMIDASRREKDHFAAATINVDGGGGRGGVTHPDFGSSTRSRSIEAPSSATATPNVTSLGMGMTNGIAYGHAERKAAVATTSKQHVQIGDGSSSPLATRQTASLASSPLSFSLSRQNGKDNSLSLQRSHTTEDVTNVKSELSAKASETQRFLFTEAVLRQERRRQRGWGRAKGFDNNKSITNINWNVLLEQAMRTRWLRRRIMDQQSSLSHSYGGRSLLLSSGGFIPSSFSRKMYGKGNGTAGASIDDEDPTAELDAFIASVMLSQRRRGGGGTDEADAFSSPSFLAFPPQGGGGLEAMINSSPSSMSLVNNTSSSGGIGRALNSSFSLLSASAAAAGTSQNVGSFSNNTNVTTLFGASNNNNSLDHPLIALQSLHIRQALDAFSAETVQEATLCWDVALYSEADGATCDLQRVEAATIADHELEERRAVLSQINHHLSRRSVRQKAKSFVGLGGEQGKAMSKSDGNVLAGDRDVSAVGGGAQIDSDDEFENISEGARAAAALSPPPPFPTDRVESLQKYFLISGACSAVVQRKVIPARIYTSPMMDASSPAVLAAKDKQKQQQQQGLFSGQSASNHSSPTKANAYRSFDDEPSTSRVVGSVDSRVQERYIVNLWDIFDPELTEGSHRSVVSAHRRYLGALEGLMSKLQRDFYGSARGGGGGEAAAECGNVPIYIRLAPPSSLLKKSNTKKRKSSTHRRKSSKNQGQQEQEGKGRRHSKSGGERETDRDAEEKQEEHVDNMEEGTTDNASTTSDTDGVPPTEYDEGGLEEEDSAADTDDPALLSFPPLLIPIILDALTAMLPARRAAPHAKAFIEPFLDEMKRIQFSTTDDTNQNENGKGKAMPSETPATASSSPSPSKAAQAAAASSTHKRSLLDSLVKGRSENVGSTDNENKDDNKDREINKNGTQLSSGMPQPIAPPSAARSIIESCRARTDELQSVGLACIQTLLLMTQEDEAMERERRRQLVLMASSTSHPMPGRGAAEPRPHAIHGPTLQPATSVNDNEKGHHHGARRGNSDTLSPSFVLDEANKTVVGERQSHSPTDTDLTHQRIITADPPAEGPMAFKMACLTDYFEKMRQESVGGGGAPRDPLASAAARRRSSAHSSSSSNNGGGGGNNRRNSSNAPSAIPLYPDVLNGPPNTIAFLCHNSSALNACLIALNNIAAIIELSLVACEIHSLSDVGDRLAAQAARMEELRKIRKVRLRKLEQEAQRAAAMEALQQQQQAQNPSLIASLSQHSPSRNLGPGGLLQRSVSGVGAGMGMASHSHGRARSHTGAASSPSSASRLPLGYTLVDGVLTRQPSATEAAVPPILLFNPSARFVHDWPNTVFAGRCVVTQYLQPLPGGGVLPMALEMLQAGGEQTGNPSASSPLSNTKKSSSNLMLSAAADGDGHPAAIASSATTAPRIGRHHSVFPAHNGGDAGLVTSASPMPLLPSSSTVIYDGEDDEPHLSFTNLQFTSLLVKEKVYRILVDARSSEVVSTLWPPKMVLF